MAGRYLPLIKGAGSADCIVPKLLVEGVIPDPAFLTAHQGTEFPGGTTPPGFLSFWCDRACIVNTDGRIDKPALCRSRRTLGFGRKHRFAPTYLPVFNSDPSLIN